VNEKPRLAGLRRPKGRGSIIDFCTIFGLQITTGGHDFPFIRHTTNSVVKPSRTLCIYIAHMTPVSYDNKDEVLSGPKCSKVGRPGIWAVHNSKKSGRAVPTRPN